MRLMNPILIVLALMLVSSPAAATSFSFFGNYTLEDSDGDGFSEELTFMNALGGGSGAIGVFEPGSDALFADGGLEYVELAVLFLDADDPFNFDPTLYASGFAIFDDDGSELLVADLTVLSLMVEGNSGSINSELAMNLGNIQAGADYEGGSYIIDSLLAYESAGISLTLQFPGYDLAAAIQSGETLNATYSGSAVPEPSTMLLLLGGLGGLAIGGSRRGA
jgi:hypothetical protein